MPVFLTPDSFTSSGSASTGPGEAYRDRDGFTAIVAALQATGEFAGIAFPGQIDQAGVGADRQPLVVLVPGRFEEVDDAGAAALLRRVSYRLTLIVRDEDDAQGYDRLDRLASIVQNTLDSSTLGGVCLPSLSWLREGRYDAQARYPEQRLILDGAFAYQVAKATGRSIHP